MTIVTNNTKSLSAIRQLVYAFVNETEDVFSPDVVDNAINFGLQNVWSAVHRNGEFVTTDTEVGRTTYTLPDPVRMSGDAVIDSVLLDDSALTFTSPLDVTGDSGTPTSYTVQGEDIILEPSPDAVGTLKVYLRPEHPRLLVDTDLTVMTDQGIEASVMYACYLLKMQDEEFESARAFKAAYDEALARYSMTPTGVYPNDENGAQVGSR